MAVGADLNKFDSGQRLTMRKAIVARDHSPERLSQLIDTAESLMEARNNSKREINSSGADTSGEKQKRQAASPHSHNNNTADSSLKVVQPKSATKKPRVFNTVKEPVEMKHPPLLALSKQAEKLTAAQLEELTENRRKALLRLIDKRRKDKRTCLIRSETQRLEDNHFRIKWREGFKEKRREQLAQDMDKCILKNMISTAPELMHDLLDVYKQDDSWDALMSDLPKGTDAITSEYDIYSDLVYTKSVSSMPPNLISSHQKRSTAEEFLHKTCGKVFDTLEDSESLSTKSARRGSVRSDALSSRSRDKLSNSFSYDDLQDAHSGNGTKDEMSAKVPLSECVFLVGPTPDDVSNLFAAEKSRMNNSAAKISNRMYRVEPSILFITKKDPEVDWDTLRYFCFPDGITASITNRVSQIRSPNKTLRRTMSTFTGSHNVRKFAFHLSGHFSTQYGVCLVAPRTYRDPELNISVTADYCLCIVTSFPFFHYFFHVMTQFEGMGGLDSICREEPLQCQEDGFPIHAELRLLDDFARRLNRMHVPLYPTVVHDGDQDSDAYMHKQPSLMLHPVTLNIAVRLQNRIKITMHRDIMQHFFTHSQLASKLTAPIGGRKRSETEINLGATLIENLPPPENEVDEISEAMLEMERDNETCFQILLWALPILLRHMPLDQIVVAIGCALTEMKVVVTSSDPSIVSGCLLALVHLLRPMKWSGTIVVNVPHHLDTLLDSPTFFFLGMRELPEGFGLPQGFVVVDPDERVVHLHPTDTVASHTLTLPQSSKLVAALKGNADTILNISRILRRKASANRSEYNPMNASHSTIRIPASDSLKSSTPKSEFNPLDSAHDKTGSFDSVEAASKPPLDSSPVAGASTHCGLPSLPVELDPSSELGKQLYSAVAGFRSTMVAHLQALVNTAIQSAWEGKRAKQVQVNAMNDPMGAEKDKLVQSHNRALKHQKQYSSMYSSKPSGLNGNKSVRSQSFGSRNSATLKSSALEEIPEFADNYDDSPPNRKIEGRAYESEEFVPPQRDLYSFDENSVSSNSSLPRMHRSQVLLAPRDIGESGMKFVKRLMETQAFSNYCHAKSQEGKRKRTRAFVDLSESLPLVESPRKDGQNDEDVQEEKLDQVKPKDKGDVRDRRKIRGQSEDLVKARSGSDVKTKGQPMDMDEQVSSLTALFSIIITGTVPMPREQIDTLRLTYELNEYQNKHAMVEDRTKIRSTTTKDVFIDHGELENAIAWCNGRCGGMANTPDCTKICFMLWEERVHLALHQKVVKQIIQKGKHDSVLRGAEFTREKYQQCRARPVPHRGGRETGSQFQLRSKMLQRDSTNEAHVSGEANPPRQGQITILPAKTSGTSKTHSAPRAIIGYVAVCKNAVADEKRKVALTKLRTFFLHALSKLAQRRFVHCVVGIQSLARRFLVRRNRLELIAMLTSQKQLRLLACIKIRNWIRNIPDDLHLKRQNMIRLRRRRIPSHSLALPYPETLPRFVSVAEPPEINESAAVPRENAVNPIHSNIPKPKGVGALMNSLFHPNKRESPRDEIPESQESVVKDTADAVQTTRNATDRAENEKNRVDTQHTVAASGDCRNDTNEISVGRIKSTSAIDELLTKSVPEKMNKTSLISSASDRSGVTDRAVRIRTPVVPVLLIAPLGEVSPKPNVISEDTPSVRNPRDEKHSELERDYEIEKSKGSSPMVTPRASVAVPTETSTSVPLTIEVEAQSNSKIAATSNVPIATKAVGTPYPTLPKVESLNDLMAYIDDDVHDDAAMTTNGRHSKVRGRLSSTDSLSSMRGRSETSASDFALSEKASETDTLFSSGSLSTIGMESRDSFTPQQREILHGMWTTLREGVAVFKHGRTGKPKQRFLYCDLQMRALFWRAHGGKPDAEMEAEFNRSSGLHPGHSSWLIGRADEHRFLVFKDILEVRKVSWLCIPPFSFRI